ncbi:hypothetical protein GRI97_17705 [Altererythrobacter xixiisoli]|uniref:Lipoprotein n=1 Tax=Croceibacterium xixiisoli TaxID=1476466 RepID=A0A6I4U1U8_9SPHN|nr:hypothetical protein [Croceibacterium xixiisoli]MXP00829.1 hypothetical protein [Croceibacterium xixiisoli]
MRKLAVCGTLLWLAACTEPVSPEEQRRADEQMVAAVEQANNAPPPVELITPDPILDADMQRHDMDGPGCIYAPGTNLSTRVVARETDAFMKLGGRITRFAADPGSRELPSGTRTLYSGRGHTLRLNILAHPDPSQPASPDTETPEPDGEQHAEQGSIMLRDAFGRVVYEGSGFAECHN